MGAREPRPRRRRAYLVTGAGRSRRRGRRSAEGDEAMSDDRRAMDGEAERVGYSRPPKHTQFQKGNRAYLHRRRTKDRDDFAELVRDADFEDQDCEGGRKRTVTRGEANILALFDKAKRGDAAASHGHRPARSLGQGRRRGPMSLRSQRLAGRQRRVPRRSPKVRRSARHRGAGTSHEAWRKSRSQISLLPDAVHVVAPACGATGGRNRIRRIGRRSTVRGFDRRQL